MVELKTCVKCGKQMSMGYIVTPDGIYCKDCYQPTMNYKRLVAKYGRLVFIEMVGNGLTLDDAIAKYQTDIDSNGLNVDDVKDYATYLYERYG